MKAYTRFGEDGAITTSTRPHGCGGKPLPSSVFQVLPPSAVRKSALPLTASGPSPPERNVHPLRRKSHIPANSVFGVCGSIDIIEHPVDALAPLRTLVHVLPPSVVLYTPRSSLSLQSLPGTQT